MKKFLLFYILYILLFFSILEIPFIVHLFPIEEVTSSLAIEATKISLQFIGIKADVEGIAFKLDNATMLLEPECNGLKPILLFIAVILAYPSSKKVKYIWIIGSIVVLQSINIIRITFLTWVLRYHLDYFDFIHDYISPVFVMSIALFMFYKYVDIANASLQTKNL